LDGPAPLCPAGTGRTELESERGPIHFHMLFLDGVYVDRLDGSAAADKNIAQSYKYHANSYIVKPMDFSEFEILIDNLGHYWLAWNQNLWR
jgi:hypothetical protein